MKKVRIALIVVVVGVSILLAWKYIRKTDTDNKTINTYRQKSGPKFKKEGILYFINPTSADTLSSIYIEIADRPEKIGRGLMYRSMMDSDQGMLFVFDFESEQSFWMKNTQIPLDIIFINDNYQIVHIAKHTIPYSKDPIPSIYPARYVLEVNAGFCNQQKIELNYIIQFIIYNSLSL